MITLGFTVTPSSITVGVNNVAVFRCQHQSAQSISWRVNGSSVSGNTDITPSTNRAQDGSLTYTLMILARPTYNGTEVECIALFLDSQPEVSPTATLIIIEGSYIILLIIQD